MKKVFISYSHKDTELKEKFKAHLSGLIRQKIIKLWDDEEILIGNEWDNKIKENLQSADIIIFLISSDFLASEYINKIEIDKAIRKHHKKEVLIAPIFLRPCDFESSILAKFQGVPKDSKFITTWDNIDSAFLAVIKELKRIFIDFKPKSPNKESSTYKTEKKINSSDTPPDISKWVGREGGIINFRNRSL